MKILLDHDLPFSLAHGGFQVQIEQTHDALKAIGLEVEWLRWWDTRQRGDLIHFFGRPSPALIRHAHLQGMKFVFSELMSGTGARSPALLRLQWLANRVLEGVLPKSMVAPMSWESFRTADAIIALTSWEAHLMQWLFRAPPDRVHVVHNGVEPEFLESSQGSRGPWLITTASILPVKRIVETARAAVEAGTPYWVIGRPFSEGDAYYREFVALQRANPRLVRYEGPIRDRALLARIYREARGFVMLSRWESLSISALEAAGCGCPLLLSDLPWAHSVFGDRGRYAPKEARPAEMAAALRQFYDEAPRIPPLPRPAGWGEVAETLREIYASLLAGTRAGTPPSTSR